MDLNRLTRDADDLIRKVVSRYNQLYLPAGSVSQLELDLMLDDLRKLYDTFKTIGQLHLSLQNDNARPEVSVKPQETTQNVPETRPGPVHDENPQPTTPHSVAQSEPATYPLSEAEAEPGLNTDMSTLPETLAENISPAEPDTTAMPAPDNAMPAEVKPGEESLPDKLPISDTATATENTPTLLADKFNTGSKSLSETIASPQIQGEMASRLLYQPIADLSSGIGLNDKFSFISELFTNNPALYDEAITRINKAVNNDEAGWILQKYHTPDWDQKTETLARLKDFIKRRFI